MAITTSSLTRSVQAEADAVIHAVMATPEGHADPYPHYRRLRELAPVHRSDLDGVWYISDFETSRQILGDARIGVFAILAAANRDPGRFADPDRFDIGRTDNLHLAFAWGLHFCLGARLARMEGQLVFAGLRERFCRLELLEEPVRRPGLAIRALDSLPVHFTPR
jgi:cytochrome P450